MNRKYDLSKFTLDELLTMCEIVSQFIQEFEMYKRTFMRYMSVSYTSNQSLSIDNILSMILRYQSQQSQQQIQITSDEDIQKIREKLKRVSAEIIQHESQIQTQQQT